MWTGIAFIVFYISHWVNPDEFNKNIENLPAGDALLLGLVIVVFVVADITSSIKSLKR